MVSGIPVILGLRTRMQDPHAHVGSCGLWGPVRRLLAQASVGGRGAIGGLLR